MLKLRPTTNLKIPDNLMLNTEDNRRGFLNIYNLAHRIPSPLFFVRLLFGSVIPDIVYHKKFATKKAMRSALRGSEPYPAFLFPSNLLSIKKVVDQKGRDPHFLVKIPLLAANDASVLVNLPTGLFEAKDIDNEARALLDDFKDNKSLAMLQARVDGPEQAIANLRATGTLATALNESFISAGIEQVGSQYIAFATFTLESFEASQLTTTPFEQIRPNDLYAILLAWVDGYYGAFKRPPKAAFPIGSIAETLPESPLIKPRTNEANITIDSVGTPIIIPPNVNNIAAYDQKFLNAGYREDGSFQLLSPEEFEGTVPHDLSRRLPANQPIFVDWANAKFTYSNGSGRLDVYDLAQCRAPSATMLVRIMKQPYDVSLLKNIANIGMVVGVGITVTPTAEDVASLGPMGQSLAGKLLPLVEYVAKLTPIFQEQTGYEYVRWCDLNGSTFAPFKVVYRHLLAIGLKAYENMEVVYNHYSVIHACRVMAYITLLGIYGKPEKFTELESQDWSLREDYVKQGEDEDWKDPGLPLTGEKLGQLPHQKRARNQLRNLPKNAVLQIPAGGGKTPLLITDVLAFIRANKAAPYLIMCPSHLVAQYVTEINTFTDGKINAIPINTATLSSNSLDRVTKVIQTMPRNTVVIVDYDVTSRILSDDIVYGTAPVTVYHVIEFLRQFGFQYVGLDEAHYLRNSSRRTEAVQSLIIDIPYKRLASGTFAHDSMSDLAYQMGMLDPTMFGSREDFNATYGQEVVGNRVIQWKSGAEQAVNSMLRSNIVMCKAHRKEWAALLPPLQEHLHLVQLSPEQKRAYDLLFAEVTEELKEAAATNPLLRKWLERQSGSNDDTEDLAEEEIQSESLEKLLKTYLARVERFLTSMGRDDWGKIHLSGEDLESPKIKEIIKIIQQHVDQKLPGKIIVFTNYVWSAEEIYRALPPALKKRFILYKAATKVEAIARFEHPDIIGMIGVSASMDTGLNLQSASRLIRDGLVWNPGTLEQGDSRIGRPQLKTVDKRDFIYYDTVLCNNTLDVTKLVRIYSKLLSVEKYNNAGDSRYAELPDLEVVSMSFDSIQQINDVQNPMVLSYIDGYRQYKQVRDEDYKEYREKYSKKGMVLEAIPKCADPKDSYVMRDAVYAPGGDLYGQAQMGLIRLDQFLGANITLEDSEDDEDDLEDVVQERNEAWLEQANALTKNMPCHTEFGDGVVSRVLAANVSVRLKTGEVLNMRRSTVFVKTKPVKDVRASIATLNKVKLQADQDIPLPYYFKKGKQKSADTIIKDVKAGPPKVEPITAELYVNVINGFLALEYHPTDAKDRTVPALQSVGFRFGPEYKYAEIANAQRLLRQFKLWDENGFAFEFADAKNQFKVMYELLKSGKLRNEQSMFKFAKAADLRNFLRLEFKPSNKAKTIKPFPLLDNGVAYIALPSKGQLATRKAIALRAPGIHWYDAEPVLQCFTLSVQKTLVLLERVQKNGIQIANLSVIKKELTKIKRQPINTEGQADI